MSNVDPKPFDSLGHRRRGNERQRGNEAKQLLWNVISPLTGIYPARQEAVLCGRSSEGEGGGARGSSVTTLRALKRRFPPDT